MNAKQWAASALHRYCSPFLLKLQNHAGCNWSERADSIVKLLQNGADFKELALQFSNDNLSYQNGGELPEFGVGRYDQF